MTIYIGVQAHVGTTYKRALTKLNPVRDQVVPNCPAHNSAFGNATRYTLSITAKGVHMRKPRDFDAALRALNEKTKTLKENKRRQLGDLVIETGADALDVETLAGALFAVIQTKDAAQRENWRKAGTEFFRSKTSKSVEATGDDPKRAAES